jgi:hypothetical protein
MDEKIIQNITEYIVNQESKKIVGKVCKRFELEIDQAKANGKNTLTIDEVNNLKLHIKELLYEWTRDLRDMLNTGKVVIDFINKRKEG